MVDPRLIAAVEELIALHSNGGRVPVVAVAGAQGSGKSTLANAAAEAFGAVALSLDDFYLGRAERARLAETVHPLFAVRGPPGTHDLAGLHAALDRLTASGEDDRVSLPVFDKLSDEQGAPRIWIGRPKAVLIEGWCLGAQAQTVADLSEPLNALERQDDPDGVWRAAVNDRLATSYAAMFKRFDALMFLRVPGFGPVLDWRCEQEVGLLGVAPRSAIRSPLCAGPFHPALRAHHPRDDRRGRRSRCRRRTGRSTARPAHR